MFKPTPVQLNVIYVAWNAIENEDARMTVAESCDLISQSDFSSRVILDSDTMLKLIKSETELASDPDEANYHGQLVEVLSTYYVDGLDVDMYIFD